MDMKCNNVLITMYIKWCFTKSEELVKYIQHVLCYITYITNIEQHSDISPYHTNDIITIATQKSQTVDEITW